MKETFLTELKPNMSSKIAYIRRECSPKNCKNGCDVQTYSLLEWAKKKIFPKSFCKKRQEISETFPFISPFLITERLFSLGIVPGKEITMIGTSPLNDPIIIDIAGHLVSLRKVEADFIIVEG
jgi:Fe2+ transport system protein FeoA